MSEASAEWLDASELGERPRDAIAGWQQYTPKWTVKGEILYLVRGVHKRSELPLGEAGPRWRLGICFEPPLSMHKPFPWVEGMC